MKQDIVLCAIACYGSRVIGVIIQMTDKPAPGLQEFIDNVNKKDKLNGKRVKFGFAKRKRKN